MSARLFRGAVAVAGIGETAYYKHGQSPDSEFVLALKAILKAAADAGIDARQIDGFASYSNDRSDPSRIAAALGIRELRFANMHWGGGGGGGGGGGPPRRWPTARRRSRPASPIAWSCSGPWPRASSVAMARRCPRRPCPAKPYMSPYGVLSPAQKYAMRATRFMHRHGIGNDALRAIALASYSHAQSNPRAVRYGRPLDASTYDRSRWIVEPVNRLYDCCQENDGAAALILVSAERAKDLRQKAVYLLAAAQGSDHRCGAPVMNATNFASSSFASVAPRLYAAAGVSPRDIDVVQSYENFTTGVLMAIVEHGFCTPEEANDFFTLENLHAPSGKLPLNTSGGNLAECYVHGFGLQLESVRQLRGQSCNQVPGARLALNIAGPMVTPVSSLILGVEETLG